MSFATIFILISISFIILARVVYLIWFYSSGKHQNLISLKEFYFSDTKSLYRLKTQYKALFQRFTRWLANVLIPALKQNLAILWKRDTRLGYFLEIIFIAIWAIFVGRAYLNMDRFVWPWGVEFAFAIKTHYIWNNLLTCGECVFWNGSFDGGAPAFANMHGSMLYPLVVFFTLLLGPLNGAKILLISSLFLGGIAQWWLSKIMGFSRVPRLWSGLIAVVGGHLAARMESGAVGVILSTAACSLVIAPGVALGLTGKRRYAILLGMMVGLAFLSGQGYMQVGMTLSILLAFVVFLPGREIELKNIWKEYLLAAFIAFLVAGIFFIPMIHFYSNFSKTSDISFGSAEVLRYIPLNHLINDFTFYRKDSLIPGPSAHLYANFLGWVPILLAILAWRFIPRSKFRLLTYFLVAIILSYLAASGDSLRLISMVFPVAAGVRFTGVIAGLANPLILGLSAWGLDAILKTRFQKPEFISRFQKWSDINVVLLILTVPLLWSLKEAYDFGQTWLSSINIPKVLYSDVEYLKTESSEWVSLPFGIHFWLIPALDAKLKIGGGVQSWLWNGREIPPINQEATINEQALQSPNLTGNIGDLYFLSYPDNEYAFIRSGNEKIVCKAKSVGGNIDVNCPQTGKGQLIVYENYWTGWYARVDQKDIPLLQSKWLSVEAPAGKHTYQFRYRPWDVWVGFLLTLIGIGLSVFLWRRSERVFSL
jgi:hypothetical protein